MNVIDRTLELIDLSGVSNEIKEKLKYKYLLLLVGVCILKI